MTNINKRERLIDSAAKLFHHNGMAATSLADIAKHADIPIGNVYYYFKTKEELALATVSKRKEQFSASYTMLEETIADPRQRLIEFIRHYENDKSEYAKFGCPIGKITMDADVEKDSVAKTSAQIFSEFIIWAEHQFKLLGHQDAARAYAVSLMAGMQGAFIMAKSFTQANIIADEIERLTIWLESLPNKKIQLGKVGLRGAVQPVA